MVRCIDCVKLEKCAKTSGKPQIVEVVPGCEDGKRKPLTNGDKIRGMTDEELAGKFEEIQLKTVRAYGNDDLLLKDELKGYWLDWLRQEAQT